MFFLTERHNFHIAVFKIDFFHKNEEKNVFFSVYQQRISIYFSFFGHRTRDRSRYEILLTVLTYPIRKFLIRKLKINDILSKKINHFKTTETKDTILFLIYIWNKSYITMS